MLSQEQLQKLWLGPDLAWPTMTRNKVLTVNQLELNKVLSDHQNAWKHMPGYESVSKPQAVKGDALAELHPFLAAMLEVAPSGEINATQLKAGIMAAVVEKPELNNTKQKNDIWCGLRLDRITTVLYHLRRLTDNVKFQQMVLGSQGASVVLIKQLLDKLQPATMANGQLPIANADGSAASTKTTHDDTEPEGTTDHTQQGEDELEPRVLEEGVTPQKKLGLPNKKHTTTLSGPAFQQLWGQSKETPTPVKKKLVKPSTVTQNGVIYRKEYYKANHAFGIKKLVNGKAKQIFSLPGRSWSKEKLTELADKVLHDLHKCKCEADEMEVQLIAKYKLGL